MCWMLLVPCLYPLGTRSSYRCWWLLIPSICNLSAWGLSVAARPRASWKCGGVNNPWSNPQLCLFHTVAQKFQWGWAPISQSSHLLISSPLSDSFSFPDHSLFPTSVSLDNLSSKLISFKSMPQGLLLKKSNLTPAASKGRLSSTYQRKMLSLGYSEGWVQVTCPPSC